MTDIKWFKVVFLRYLKRGKALHASFSDFLTDIFRLNKRLIVTITCTQDVELRGAVWIDSKPVNGLINRRVLNMKAGQVAWLRVDETEPFVTLENSRGCVNIDKGVWNAKYRANFTSA